MGLPHVLVRFYTNPDGRAARRTALAVHRAAVGVLCVPDAARGVRPAVRPAVADHRRRRRRRAAVARRRDRRVRPEPLLAALVAAGAIAAFLSTSSGLLVSIAGVLTTDVLRGRVRDFRLAAVVGGLVPIPLALAASSLELSRNVGLVFAVAASTLCPLLVLGIWWRGLTAAGAICGLIVGGALSRNRGHPGRDRSRRRGPPRRLARSAGGLPRGRHACRSRSWRWCWSAGSPRRPRRAMSHASSRACMCRSASAWGSNGSRISDDERPGPAPDRLTDLSLPLTARLRDFGVSTWANAGYVTCSLNRLTRDIQNTTEVRSICGAHYRQPAGTRPAEQVSRHPGQPGVSGAPNDGCAASSFR